MLAGDEFAERVGRNGDALARRNGKLHVRPGGLKKPAGKSYAEVLNDRRRAEHGSVAKKTTSREGIHSATSTESGFKPKPQRRMTKAIGPEASSHGAHLQTNGSL